jgi:hypothetical protein
VAEVSGDPRGGWQSFESRMRARRIAVCLNRARIAMRDGRADDLAAELAELRTLDCDPGVLAELSAAPAVQITIEPPTHAQTAIVETPTHHGRPLVLVLLGAAAIGGVLVASRYYLRPQAALPAASASSDIVLPVETPPRPPALRIVQETVFARVIGAQPEGTTGDPRVPTAPIAANGVTPPEVAPIDPPRAPAPPPATDTTVPALPLPTAPPSPIAASNLAPVDLPAAAPPRPATEHAVNAAPPPAPTVRVDERERVREILMRYESAYSSLDAAAAREIWPSVDQRALARAFDGLAAQDVSLGRCNVQVNGGTARADCSGTARWTPKVGGGAPRQQARQWSFELKNVDENWRIVSAQIR